jgi:hypothetical protein
VRQAWLPMKNHLYLVGTKLVREPGAWSRERGKRERGAGIDVRIPEMKDFH